jgi:aminoglycoside phosphotransferase family enzyme/predicted kinase
LKATQASADIDSERLLAALRDPSCYPHPTGPIELIETHISWVLLAGDYAYKLKKPIDLGFLDFSALAARRFYCEEELRLNRRTAAELYLEVVAIVAQGEGMRVTAPDAGTAALEYALKMRRFPQEALADRMAARGELGAPQIDALAPAVAAFHAAVPRAEPTSAFGAPEHVSAPALENFEQMQGIVAESSDARRLERLRGWTQAQSARLHAVFAARKRAGFVRECHGDLHLGNIAFIDGRPLPFDCIEFNPELRWIDTANEVAFLGMDLLEHRVGALAWRFLNAYLEATGDYGGVRVLRYYLVYRAMVRAKIACIRSRQPDASEEARSVAERQMRDYLALAESLAASSRPALMLMHGLSGSGKTTIAQTLLERVGALRARSDVERKRLRGLAARARTGAELRAGIYAPETTRLTYDALQAIARDALESGWSAIVDATFLRRAEREAFAALARELGVPLVIVSCRADAAELRRRIAQREATAADASEASVRVLEDQIVSEEPLAAGELARAVVVDSAAGEAELERRMEDIEARLRAP